jgi:hypothetical protein
LKENKKEKGRGEQGEGEGCKGKEEKKEGVE